jgi:hypothetical protein
VRVEQIAPAWDTVARLKKAALGIFPLFPVFQN